MTYLQNIEEIISEIVIAVSVTPPLALFLQCCAVAFIEKLDAHSLNLSVEDFERHMCGGGGGSGDVSPRRRSESSSLWPLELLSSLQERQQQVLEEARGLQAELQRWQECVAREVQGILDKYPLEIKRHATHAIDSENKENDRLPPPLQPQVFADSNP